MTTNHSPAPIVLHEAEADFPEVCENLRKGFSTILDPELGLKFIQLGLVRNVIINENNAIIRMILTTPFCPYGPSMLESARQKAEEVLEVKFLWTLSGSLGFFNDGRRYRR
jgi:metal-sulfur cluster biosynthetic enzyme